MDKSLKSKPRALRKSIQDELIELDGNLLALLTKRSQLLTKARQLCSSPGQARQDINLDKHLWQIWDSRMPKDATSIKFYRTIFTLLQELASKKKPPLGPLSRPETVRLPVEREIKATVTTEQPRSFLLAPRQVPIGLDIIGPGCMEQTQLFAALAAMTEQPAYISGIIINNPLRELVKALNQVGANLRCVDSALRSNGVKYLDFDNKLIFCGNNPFNAYLLLALATARSTRCKLAGGSGIRMLDLAAFRRLASHLGSRLAGVAPGAPSIPIRIEASAVPADIITIPDDLPPLAAMAIVGVAPAYPNGLSLRWSPDGHRITVLKSAISLAVKTLKQCGVPCTWGSTSLTIDAAVPALPKKTDLALDPWISTALLALPRLHSPGKSGGMSRIIGTWPQGLTVWQEAEQLLAATGLIIKVDDTGISTSTTISKHNQLDREPTTHHFDATLYPEALPLAVAMLAATVLAEREPRMVLIGVSKQEHAISCELLERVGLVLSQTSNPTHPTHEGWTVTRQPSPLLEEPAPWTSPAPLWTIAYALLARRRPGLRLSNPNNISDIMPQFWSLYNSLPNPPHDILFKPQRPLKEQPIKEQQATEYSPRRRIRV